MSRRNINFVALIIVTKMMIITQTPLKEVKHYGTKIAVDWFILRQSMTLRYDIDLGRILLT